MRKSSLALAAGGLLALVLFATVPARAGDPDVAKLLFDKGEKAARSRDWEEAENYYRRALKEYSPLPDAAFGLGEVLEKQGKTNEAIDAYLLCKDQILGIESPDRSQTRLLDKAERAVRRLGEGYAELADIDKAFVKDCLVFGRRFFHSDPGWAKKAFQHAIELEPGNKLVQGYLDRLSETKAPESAAGLYEPLIHDDGLSDWDPGAARIWTCKGGIIRAETDGTGGFSNFVKDYYEGTFSLSARFRVLETKGPKPVCGIILARKKDTTMDALLILANRSEIDLCHFGPDGIDSLGTKLLTRIDFSAWHELRVDVTPGKAVAFLDGREIFRANEEAKDTFDGPGGLFVQQMNVEIKDVGVRK